MHRLSRLSQQLVLPPEHPQASAHATASMFPEMVKKKKEQEQEQAAAAASASAAASGDGKTQVKFQVARSYPSRQLAGLADKKNQSLLTRTNLQINEVYMYNVTHLSDYMKVNKYPNHFVRTKVRQAAGSFLIKQIIQDNEVILMDISRKNPANHKAYGFLRAGIRKEIIWKQGEVKAAIVTCGGLCPGLNDVVAELVKILYYNYGVDIIYGIRDGYRGFYGDGYLPWKTLTPAQLFGVQDQGGTVLGTSRGGFDGNAILEQCVRHGVNQIYCIGGDGTHRGCDKLAQLAKEQKLKMCVVGIPKTIDNDIGIIDRSFGFDTAIDQAEHAIKSARVEASSTPNGIGLVKLMGRHAGFIAAHAALASKDVDLCLIPEEPFALEGANGILRHIHRVLREQKHAVIVVAEGAGEDMLKSQATETDASGNKKLPDIGKFLADNITAFFKKKKIDVVLKYHDPSYMVRSCAADASDRVYCMSIAANAVHGAMAGYTGFSSGLVNNRTVYIPISLITSTSPARLNPDGRTWERVLSATHQPKFLGARKAAKAK